VCIDAFLFGPKYMDVATLSAPAKYTGGSTFFYPNFNGNNQSDQVKYAKEMKQFLSLTTALEAVVRVRASKGIGMTDYHGNFFVRSMDLLALPNVEPDNSYAVELSVEEQLVGPVVYFQTAVLHTSCFGERRIRVLTLALPVTSSMAEIYSSVNPFALANLLMKKGISRALSSKLEDARDALLNKCVELLAAQLACPESLKLFPLLTLAMLKNVRSMLL
jgi:protein transport protein SEC24